MSQDDPLQAWLASHPPSPEDAQAFREVSKLLEEASPLGRSYCPSREDLIAPASEIGVTLGLARTRHLTACPLCRSDLADYEALSELEPSTALGALKATLSLLWDQASGAIRQVESGLAPAFAPALALRGEESPRALAHLAALERGHLRLTWAVGSEGVDLLCEAEQEAPSSYRVDLTLGDTPPGNLVESRSADEEGRVRLLGLTPGHYRIEVFVPEASQPAVEVSLQLRS
ncbi:MAG: hypothetical protein JKY65_24385 [Planctomycetes bacterium]|nr:hypothetical protein [Planctomycetota bacterium]